MVDHNSSGTPAERPLELFLRIPGSNDESAADSPALSLNGRGVSPHEFLSLLESGALTDYVLISRTLNTAQLSRSELHKAAAILFRPSATEAANAADSATALVELLLSRASSPEAAFIAIQVLKAWSSHERYSQLSTRLLEALVSSVEAQDLSPDLSRRQCNEVRYLLLRAFESEALHPAAARAIRNILASANARLVAERKELASNLIASANSLRFQSEQLGPLKRLAAAVFASGTAPASLREAIAAEGQPKRISFLVTAQDAERRRQFGLASAIELHKAATLIGRQMTLAEHELALTFHHGTESSTPGNQRWLSRDEWLTAQRLIMLAVEELPTDTLAAAGLLHLLASKVKAEDPTDSRVSFKRPDAVDYLTRRKVLKEAERIASTVGATPEQVELVSQEQSERLFQPAFLVHNPVVTSLQQAAEAQSEGPNSLPKGNSAINLGTNDLTTRLLRDNSPTLVSRLVAADFGVLKKAQGLDADQFRILLERIRPRAITDPWARLAFLDIVRAPHAAPVNVRVRTAALGALVNDARRLGKLTPALEKEVFAVSAEVPHLEHLAGAQAEENEDSRSVVG